MNQKKKKNKKKRKEKAFNHRVSSCFLNRKVQINENLKLKKKKIKISKITFEREQQRGNNKSIDPIKLSKLKRKAFVIDEHSELKKKKKNQSQFSL